MWFLTEVNNAFLDFAQCPLQKAGEQRREIEILKQQADEENVKLEKRKKVIDVELAEIEPQVSDVEASHP